MVVALLVLMIELHILCLKNKGRPRAAVEALDQIIEKRQRQLSRKEKILGKLEKAEAADLKIVAQACCSSQINVARTRSENRRAVLAHFEQAGRKG